MALSVAVAVLYPAMIHWGIVHGKASYLAMTWLAILAVRLSVVVRKEGFSAKPYLPLVGIAIASAGLAAFALFVDARVLLHIPTAVNLMLFLHFSYSYCHPPTIVETFARADFPVMPENALKYCERVTLVWCGALLLGAGVSYLLAQHGSRRTWIAWSSAGIYVYYGIIFGVEFIYRQSRIPGFQQALEAMTASDAGR